MTMMMVIKVTYVVNRCVDRKRQESFWLEYILVDLNCLGAVALSDG